MAKEELLSAYTDTDDRLIALTDSGCYAFKTRLTEKQRKTVIKRLTKAMEIDTEHWKLEFPFCEKSI